MMKSRNKCRRLTGKTGKGLLGAGILLGAVSFALGDCMASERLPQRFDLRENETISEVFDQGEQGTCWAFASLTALASSMPTELRTPLSADHMTHKNSFGLSEADGGDYSVASAYLLAWQGPVAEKDDVYGDGISPDGLEPLCHVQTIKILKEKDYEAIKRAVFETGGVQSSLYLPAAGTGERQRYYREDTCALFYDGGSEANHDVVIVGWDDNYPKENFVNQPSADGAFLCVNSWGKGFGDGGFFYVSYEDSQIGLHNVLYAGVENTGNYDRIYQTDLCGWTGQLGYGTSEVWIANVYEAAGNENVLAAGFYALAPDTRYQIYVVPVPAGKSAAKALTEFMSGGNRCPAASGTVSDAGFYTVALEHETQVDAGTRFAVAARIDSPGTGQPAAVEYRSGERTANVDINDGEGYISFNGTVWERSEKTEGCNVCLKAYTKKRP